MKYLLLILCFYVAEAGYKTEYIDPVTSVEYESSTIYDFGRELQGGIMIKSCQTATIFVRFGEAISETTIEDASTEYEYDIVACDSNFFGNTGFRFVRITNLPVCELKARHTVADYEQRGKFESSDTLLNRIWSVGAYTALLNIQNGLLWDGIKRDRMVWAGDLYVQSETLYATVGVVPEIKASLEYLGNQTNINGIAGYNIWWVLSCWRYYEHTGDTAFLVARKEKMYSIIDTIASMIYSSGEEHIFWGWKFLDWDMGAHLIEKTHAGYQALAVMLFDCSLKLNAFFVEENPFWWNINKSLKQHPVNSYGSPMAWSLCVLAGVQDSAVSCEVSSITPYSTYFYLQALSQQGKHSEGIAFVKSYYGRMLELGASTFWERFRLSENINSVPLDSLVEGLQYLYHPHCGISSLCHAWSSGVTAWLSQSIAGFNYVKPDRVEIQPNLTDLKYVNALFPANNKTISLFCWNDLENNMQVIIK